MNILTALALLLVPASPGPVPITPAHTAAVRPLAVIVKIGEASLEEYTHGNPNGRIQLLSGSRSTKKF